MIERNLEGIYNQQVQLYAKYSRFNLLPDRATWSAMQCKNLGNIRGQVSIAAQAALNANNISDNNNNNNGVKIFLIIIKKI